MLPGRDALQFEAGYLLRYLEAKEEDAEERLGGLGEVAAFDIPIEEVLASSHIGEVRGQNASEGERGSGAVLEGVALLNPPVRLILKAEECGEVEQVGNATMID